MKQTALNKLSPRNWGMEKLRQDLVARGYMAGWKLVTHVPLPLARRLFNLGADIGSRFGYGAPQLRKNLSRIVGEQQANPALVRAAMRSYARYWLEAFRLPNLVGDPQTLASYAAGVAGIENLEAAAAANKGVVLVLPHSGNWDMAGMFLVQRFGSFTTVAERLQPESLYDAFVEFRESLGFQVLPLTGGKPPFPQLKAALERGEIVCLLGERDLRRHGVPVEFFGEATRMPAGAAKLVQETGAALLVVHSWFQDDSWGTSISAPIAHAPSTPEGLAAMMQQIADVMQENIAQHPVDWHMLQPLWIADLDQERYQRGLADANPQAADQSTTDSESASQDNPTGERNT